MKNGKRLLAVLLIVVMILSIAPVMSAAEPVVTKLEVKNLDKNGMLVLETYKLNFDTKFEISYMIKEGTDDTEDEWMPISLSSSNPAVAAFKNPESAGVWTYNEGRSCAVHINAYGYTILTIKLGAKSVSFPLVVVRDDTHVKINSITAAPTGDLTLTWTPVEGISGYIISKGYFIDDDFEDVALTPVKTVRGQATAKAVIPSQWGEDAMYYIQTFITVNGKDIYTPVKLVWSIDVFRFKTPAGGADIQSVTPQGSDKLVVTWENVSPKASYTLYRSTAANLGYKKIAAVKPSADKTCSYTDKVTRGTPYYYRVVTTLNGKSSAPGKSLSNMIPMASDKLLVTNKKGLDIVTYGGYHGRNWTESDTTYYYVQGKFFYIVELEGYYHRLKIQKFNKEMELVSTKTCKLPDAIWGGFYHSPTGKNYVVVGYNNPNESRKKTVIQVIQYSSDWKKLKTASIKGSASNGFEGIYEPFMGGNVSMDQSGNTLYLITARTMFVLDDGLHHQTNIAFAIDTKTMTAKEANVDFTGHSFNQFVRFQDGNIYLVNHGDGNPRGVKITMYDDFKVTEWYSTAKSSTPFKFMGGYGENYTGATVGGMEVGATNVITVGTSQPHYKAVNGVKGWSRHYRKNVYVITTDRLTGKSKVKWLTTLDPKGKKEVKEVRLVKLTDDRFAVLYSITDYQKNKSTFYYDIIDEQGKRICHKKNSSIIFDCTTQPILYNGYITFADCRTWFKNGKGTVITKLFRIPATW